MSTQLRSIDAVSCAKVLAILYGALGLLIGAFFSLIFFLFSLAGHGQDFPAAPRFVSALLGIGGIVFFPILYAVIGAIAGLIFSSLYNVVARHFGGIEVELG